ncbi:MAG TPA: ribonuclease D [Planctomycetota bacterium]|nr:ribonuclease D [Planctomycetota bacterium]
MIVKDGKALERLVAQLRAAGRFSFDTEFMREGRYRPQLCLLQVAAPDGTSALVDPVEGLNLGPFADLLRDPAIVKVVHAGGQDFEIFFERSADVPRNVFDLQIAAAFVGIGDKIGYAPLVKAVLGEDLNKTETFTDWSQRPLTPEQIDYALEDVRPLLRLHDKLLADIRALGREAWVQEEMNLRYGDAAAYRADTSQLYRFVGGAERLDRAELAVLRELATWREQEAQATNRPRQHVVHDVALVEIARRVPKTVHALRSMRGVHPQLVARSGEEVLRRIRKGLKTPEADRPAELERHSKEPQEGTITDLLETFLRVRSPELKISPGVVASRRELAELVRASLAGKVEAADVPVLKGWRRELVGNDLLGFLQGRVRLRFDPASKRVTVESA